jgi:hypothetical protein
MNWTVYAEFRLAPVTAGVVLATAALDFGVHHLPGGLGLPQVRIAAVAWSICACAAAVAALASRKLWLQRFGALWAFWATIAALLLVVGGRQVPPQSLRALNIKQARNQSLETNCRCAGPFDRPWPLHRYGSSVACASGGSRSTWC